MTLLLSYMTAAAVQARPSAQDGVYVSACGLRKLGLT
jgi:hypothetical protein